MIMDPLFYFLLTLATRVTEIQKLDHYAGRFLYSRTEL